MSYTPDASTVGSALASFLELVADRAASGALAAATLEMHEINAALILRRLPAATPLASLSAGMLDSWARDEQAGRRERRLTNGTMAKRLSTLRQALELARRRGQLAAVPPLPEMRAQYRPRTAHLRTLAELERLCDALPSSRGIWVRLAVWTGHHPADVDRMRAYVDADPFARPPWLYRLNTKNRRHPLRVRMPVPLAKLLRRHFADAELRHGDPIAAPWAKNSRTSAFRRASARAGLRPAITATSLRHTCATWAAHKLRAITPGLAAWLGHSGTAMLERVYAHALPAGLEEVARALSSFGARKGPRRTKRNGSDGVPPEQVGTSGAVQPEGPRERLQGRGSK